MTQLIKNLIAWLGWIFWVLLALFIPVALFFLLFVAWDVGLLPMRSFTDVLRVLLFLVAGGGSLLCSAFVMVPLIEAIKDRTLEKLRWDQWAELVAWTLFGLFLTVGPVLLGLLFWLGWGVPVPAPSPRWLFFAWTVLLDVAHIRDRRLVNAAYFRKRRDDPDYWMSASNLQAQRDRSMHSSWVTGFLWLQSLVALVLVFS